jgi:hypothetical protein
MSGITMYIRSRTRRQWIDTPSGPPDARKLSIKDLE